MYEHTNTASQQFNNAAKANSTQNP